MAAKTSKWTKPAITKMKAEVKAELDVFADNPEERLRHALAKIASFRSGDGEADGLKCLIFIISALVHSAARGGLKDSDVAKLRDQGFRLLRREGIKPKSSLLGFLYGELYTSLSQIHRRNGKHWRSAWELQMARRVSLKDIVGGKGFELMAQGIRLARLGYVSHALEDFTKAEEHDLNLKDRQRCGIERLKCLRLLGETQAAGKLAAQLLEQAVAHPNIAGEISWEQLLQKVYQGESPACLISSVKSRGPHHSYAYIIDAFVWTRILATNRWLESIPTVKALAFNPELPVDNKLHILRFARQLERCYNHKSDIDLRLVNLGKILTNATRVKTVDHELMVWAASARWLARNQCSRQANLCLGEYVALSLRITNGKTGDVFGCMDDLIEKLLEPGPKNLKPVA